ncbi:MAG: M1 family metallopeptidase, partial [Planctomycetota bacterium]
EPVPAAAAPAPAATLAQPALDARPGAVGIGDPLFPELGNGGYDVDDYELTLRVDAAGNSIEAQARIRAKATQDLSSFDLDFSGLELDSLELDGAPVPFERKEAELVITPAHPLANGAAFEVLARYHGTPTPVSDPTVPFADGIGWIAHKGEIYVVSEPSGASSFFPANDHPLDKATYTFRVTVKKPLVVAANGLLVETIDAGDETTYVWRSNTPMASYLATICIAEFVVEKLEGPGGLPIVNFYTPSSKPKARQSFAKTGEIIAFFSEKFGPYPFESGGAILASARIPGALETQTRPVYGAGVGGESVVSHELSHQWFGDCVSLERWQDIWLNEGFATYAGCLWTEHAQGPEKFEKELYGMYKRMRLGKGLPPGKPAADQLFGSGVYVRGGLTLHALRLEVGDEKFFQILQTWLKIHHNANARTEDFVSLSSIVAGRDLKPFLDAWLYDEKMPSIGDWDARVEAERKAREEEKARKAAEKAAKQAANQAEKEVEGEKKDG